MTRLKPFITRYSKVYIGLLQTPQHQWLQRLHPLQIYEYHIFVFCHNSSDSSFYLSISPKK